jgi:hypothetical protein
MLREVIVASGFTTSMLIPHWFHSFSTLAAMTLRGIDLPHCPSQLH